MSDVAQPPPRLWKLANAYCNDVITTEELAELETLVRADRNHRRCLFELCQMHASLFSLVRANRAFETAVCKIEDLPAAEVTQALSEATTEVPQTLPDASTQIVRPCVVEPAESRWLNRGELLRIAMAVAVSLLIAGFVMFLLRPLPQVPRPGGIAISRSADERSGGPVAIIEDDQDVRWSSETASAASARKIQPGELLKIDSGIVELHLASGVRLSVEGPAECTVVGGNSATLDSGKLVAHVPVEARGFVLKTPSARIVDLGTRFGVFVGQDEQTDVVVFQGEVDVFAGDDLPDSSAAGQAQAPRRLTAGKAVQVRRAADGGAVEALPLAFDRQPYAKSLVRFASPADAVQPTIAYRVPPGLTADAVKFQAVPLSLGMDFKVELPIEVTRLGVYDWQEDGIEGSAQLVTEIWERDDGGTPYLPKDDRGARVVARQVFTAGSPGELIDGSRFHRLSETVRLEPGAYTIVAYGFNEHNCSGNTGWSSVPDSGTRPPVWKVDHGNRRLQFVGSSRYGEMGEFPLTVDCGAPNMYAAGTFEFVPAGKD